MIYADEATGGSLAERVLREREKKEYSRKAEAKKN